MNSQDGQLAVAVLVVVFYVVVGHSVEQVQKTGAARERGRFPIAIHESAPGILIGMAISLLCGYFYKSGPSFEFDEHVFFTFALPPIIFSTGFSLKKRNFFKYFGYILTFGLLGTLIQFMIIATMSYVAINKGFVQVQQDGVVVSFNLHECMILAAVLSASDEVAVSILDACHTCISLLPQALSLIKQSEHPKLSAIMFGEGVLNDAMSVLFFRSVQRSEVSLAARALNFTTLGILLGQALYLCIMAAGLGLQSLCQWLSITLCRHRGRPGVFPPA
jgi:NhaP-type Na+/H+ or K+/H+ antiporter